MEIWTSTIRYKGSDKADVTRKFATGYCEALAPPWALINDLRYGRITEQEYESRYMDRLENEVPIAFPELLMIDYKKKYGSITLCCFCKPGAFCHRVLLAKWLESMCFGDYKGER